MSPQTVALLHTVRGEQIEAQLAVGEGWHDSDLDYVFTRPECSHPIDPDGPTRAFSKLVAELGLKPITLHGLRHAHATLLLAQGTNPKIVSERLGHSSVAFTLDVYSHMVPGLQEDAVAMLDRTLAVD